MPFITLYFLDINLTIFQISLLMTSLFLSQIIFEIPTGAIADIYGRKTSVILCYTFELIAMLAIFFTDKFEILVAIFALIGLSQTLHSGAMDAWVVDQVGKKYSKVYFARNRGMQAAGIIFAGMLGVLLVKQWGLRIIWPVSAFGMVVSILILLCITEDYKPQKVRIRESYKELRKQVKKTLTYAKNHHIIYNLLLGALLYSIAVSFMRNIVYATYLKELGLPDYALGYIWTAIMVITLLASLISLKIGNNKTEKKAIIISYILLAILTTAIILTSSILAMIIILLLTVGIIEAINPVKKHFLHRNTPNKIRASLQSVESMVLALGIVISYPIVGFAIDKIGPQYTFALTGLLLIPAVIIYSKIKE
ncbi:MAG: MFS family permease [Patescibacteria group bacterium]|jgi:MFS family permease